jgi:hypothetical protein
LFALLVLLAFQAGGAAREGNLLEGSVDACALLQEDHVRRVLRSDAVTVSKGVLTQTWGSACRWSAGSGDSFISVVVHTKHAVQTFHGLKRRLSAVRSRPDLAPQAYQSDSKIYLLKRGALVTVEWKGAADEKSVGALVRSLLEQLDELAAAQATHR